MLAVLGGVTKIQGPMMWLVDRDAGFTVTLLNHESVRPPIWGAKIDRERGGSTTHLYSGEQQRGLGQGAKHRRSGWELEHGNILQGRQCHRS